MDIICFLDVNTGQERRFRIRPVSSPYLVDLNATQASIRAGYSPRTASAIGFGNLRKPEISAAVKRGMAERGTRVQIRAKEVLDELAAIAFSDIRAIDFDPEGKIIASTPQAARSVAAYAFSHRVR